MTKRTQRELAKASQSLKIALERHDLPEVTHYYDISVEPYWSQSMAFICQIGKLKFYYENRN